MRYIKLLLPIFILVVGAGPAIAGKATSENLSVQEVRSLLPLVMLGYKQGPGTITGRAFDSATITRESISGAQICYKEVCDTTGSDGMYTLENIPDGLRQLGASAEQYYNTTEDVVVKPLETTQRDIALTPLLELSDVFMRIVLTWNSTPTWPPDNWPNDLDSHLWLEAPDPPTHISFDYRGDCTTFPNACLESDYKTGYGPETLAVRQLESTTYYFGVLNYYAGYPGVPPLTESQAKVRVYLESGVYYEFTAPPAGDGDFWYVFSLVSDGATASLQERNCITTYNAEIPTCPTSSTIVEELELRNPK